MERTDTNERRKKKKEPLALIRLKSDAIPTIFPNCPAYLSKETPNRTSGDATSENRNYEQRVKEKNNILDEADKVESINDLLLKLDRSLLPDVVLESKTENILIFFNISFEAIRIQSLVSIDGFNIKEIREIFSDISAEKSMEVEINSGLITEYWHENKMEFSSLQKGDEGIKYYCAGFVARSLIKRST